MGRPKGNKRIAAEKALVAAIEDETTSLKAELAAAEQRIVELEGLLRRIAEMATREVSVKPIGIIPPLPMVEEEQVSQGPEVELAGEDNFGEGRWC